MELKQPDSDERTRKRLIEMLKSAPLGALEMPIYYRRHLRPMEKEGLLRCGGADDDYRWYVVE